MGQLPQMFSLIGIPFPPSVLVSSLACLLFLLLVVFRWSGKSTKQSSPPQPGGSWPIIGHLHLLGGRESVLHKALNKLADEYGPIFMLKLGLLPALVVSNKEIAKECMSTHDVAFSNRPNALAFQTFGYKSAMFMVSPYGPYWREMRKITATELLSIHRLSMLKQTTIPELRASINELYQRWEDEVGHMEAAITPKIKVDLSEWFADLSLNNILSLIAGKSLRGFTDVNEKHHCKKVFRAMVRLLGEVTISDALPFLKWFDIGGYEKEMKDVAAELDAITQGWLDDHKRERASGLKEKRDFMDVLLDIFEKSDAKFFDYDVDIVIKATCQLMALASADTTFWTLTWSVSLLLNHPQVLNKAKEELNTHVGRERAVEDPDLKHLTYLQAIIKESMRLYPTVPLVPRETNTNVLINGYHVPAGTRVFLNVCKIHRDPLTYPFPNEFRPERFMDIPCNGYMDIRGQDFEYLPFGGGRRVCPGASFALQTMLFTLANLLHNFDLTPPSEESIDMSEGRGMTNVKATPLIVLLHPNLPPHLYGK